MEINIRGSATSQDGVESVWHFLSTSGNATKDGLIASGTLNVNVVDSGTVSVTGWVRSDLLNASGRGAYPARFFNATDVFLVRLADGAYIDGNNFGFNGTASDDDNRIIYNVPNGNAVSIATTVEYDDDHGVYGGNGNCSITVDGSTYYICLYCGQDGQCSMGYSGTSNPDIAPPSSDYVIVSDGFSLESLPDSITISQNRLITKANNDSYKNTISASTSGGKGFKTYIYMNDHGEESNTETTSIDYKPKYDAGKQEFNNSKAGRYSFYAYAELRGTHKYSTTLHGYTYVTPKLAELSFTGVQADNTFSPQDVVTLSWKTNSRGWDVESDFKTLLTYSKQDDATIKVADAELSDPYNGPTNTDVGIVKDVYEDGDENHNSRTVVSTINDFPVTSGTYNVDTTTVFSSSQRSVEQLNGIVKLLRKNVQLHDLTGGDDSYQTLNFIIQYQPVKALTDINVENQGRAVRIREVPTTTITWKYPHNAGAAGVVSGYIIGVYTDVDCTQQFGQDIVYATEPLQQNMTYTLDNETQLKRGVMNYIKIQPYYIKPDGTGKILGTNDTIYTGELVKPYMGLATPVIEYPINNSNWHNQRFRLLFKLPEDGDWDVYTTEQQDNYQYSNIQIKVNDVLFEYTNVYTHSSNAHPEIFSSDLQNYMENMASHPALASSFEDGNMFDCMIRVQQANYIFTPEEMEDDTVLTWSDWATVRVYNTYMLNSPHQVGDLILADHFKTLRNNALRLRGCYPFQPIDSRNIDQNRGDQIDRSEYQGVYQTIRDIYEGVNSYCTYDRAPVKFNQGFPDFTAITEIITANTEGTDRYGSTGKNYKRVLIGIMKDYLK